MHVDVNWQGKREFAGTGNSGHAVTMDAKPEVGGEDKGARPMELLLIALGGCTGIDVVSILDKMRLPYSRVDIGIDGERADEHPQRYTAIAMTYTVDAPDAPLERVMRAVRLSQNKYCSVSHSLRTPIKAILVLNGERYEVPEGLED